MIKPGCVLDADIEVKGKYANIKNFKITSQLESPAPDQNGGVKPAWIDNAKSIEAQVAIKEIGECWRAGKVTDEDGLVAIYKGWLKAKLGNALPSPSSTPITSPPVAQKAPAGSGQQPSQPLPLTAKAVYDSVVKLVNERMLTSEQAKAKAVEFGGSGNTAWDMIKSLKPDKLAELNTWLNNGKKDSELPF